MEPAKDRKRNNVSKPLDRACAGRVLPERNMHWHFVIIDGIFRKDSPKMLRVERDQMISALAPDRPDQAFSISVLPRRAERNWPVPDAHGSHPSLERAAKCSVISLSRIRYLGAVSQGNASVIWRASHSAVGFWITANPNSCRRRWPRTRNTNSCRKAIVGTTKRSIDAISST
jgi:hypothetical protein